MIERVGVNPRLYDAMARLLRYDRVVGQDTDVVIEGYPRSANSFARWAFELAQPRPLNIAHHRHVPAQVIRGVQLGKPVLVLIRRPRDACISQAIFLRDRAPLAQALRGYCRFYETALSARDIGRGFEVALFDQVVDDFGRVVERLNARFGTTFVPFDHSPANVERCFALEEEHYLRRHSQVDERGIARPSETRREEKERLLEVYESPELRDLRDKAETLFQTYSRLAVQSAA